MRGRPPLPAGPYLVVGLARSGVAAAQALRARGLAVIGADAGRPPAAGELERAGVEVHLGCEPLALLARAKAVIKSPGVPADAPLVAGARERGLTLLGELELAWRMLPCEFLAVTGTNGKTTTTELIGHLHRTAGLPVAVAGNVGRALSGLALPGAMPTGPAPTVVCEASSFQLEDAIDFAPEAAVLLNLTPDHLDRHGSLEAYRAAKLRIFARQGPEDVAVLPAGLELRPVEVGGAGMRARTVRFGAPAGEGSVYAEGGLLRCEGLEEPLLALEELALRGAHNVENAMAAAAVCLARGVGVEAVRAGLRDFAGVPHRLEELGRRDGLLYVNDSKATNVASTLVALRAFGRPGPRPAGESGAGRESVIHLILGGQGKGQDFTPLRAELERSARAVYLIGEDAPAIADALAGIAPAIEMCHTLERATRAAAAAAAPGDVLLLSPGCASFDQFADFEARGDRFREMFAAS